MSEASKALSEKLFYTKKTVYEAADPAVIEAAMAFAGPYAKYIDEGKTERECVDISIKLAEANGFTPYRFGDPLNPGDRRYYNNRGKNLFLFTVGTEDINEGIRISAAHIDSPRIDLKQCPLYEEGGMGFFKTHYYGGIKKYQWTAIPLALHGVVIKADGTSVEIVIGEDDSDPVLYINDILPHLGQEQAKRSLGEAIRGEQLNLLIGAQPYEDTDAATPVKLNIMKILNEKYGIVEEDFLTAELTAVPAFKARDIGLDRSMIGAYGHDDRVCAYPALKAIIDAADSRHTLLCILADKEETGSDGNTGMQCSVMCDLINEIALARGGNVNLVRANSKCLSADVAAAYDPNFAEVYEKRNSAILGCGVVLTKFTGSRGKGGTSDANAEYIGWLRGCMARAGVIWQTSEMGKVDVGGGGTVAKYIANQNIDVVDLGVPVISMHAPYECIAKVDLYEAYRAFAAFNLD